MLCPEGIRTACISPNVVRCLAVNRHPGLKLSQYPIIQGFLYHGCYQCQSRHCYCSLQELLSLNLQQFIEYNVEYNVVNSKMFNRACIEKYPEIQILSFAIP